MVVDSGHGGQTRDLDGDEVDGLDEGNPLPSQTKVQKLTITVIFPVDYKHAGHIVDDVSESTLQPQTCVFTSSCLHLGHAQDHGEHSCRLSAFLC